MFGSELASMNAIARTEDERSESEEIGHSHHVVMELQANDTIDS